MTYRARELLDHFDALLARPVGTQSIAILRIGVGLIAFWLLRPIAVDAIDGRTYLDRFHDPFFDAVPRLTESGFTVLMTAGALAALAMAAGLATRWSSVLTAAALGYYLAASTVHLHNNRAYLFAVLVGVSLAPAGRSWSVDRWIASRRGRERDEVMPGWPLWLLRFTCSLVYAASGLSKLVDPDWFDGTVTWGRIITHEADLRASVLPEFTVDLLIERSVHTVAAKTIVLTELFIAAGLWWRPTRWWAVATAVVFHVSIELSARVETFSYLAITVLIIWADPDLTGVRDVTLRRGPHRNHGGDQPVEQHSAAEPATSKTGDLSPHARSAS